MGEASVPRLLEFLELLTVCCKTRIGEHAIVIFYDSLDEAGQASPAVSLALTNRLKRLKLTLLPHELAGALSECAHAVESSLLRSMRWHLYQLLVEQTTTRVVGGFGS